MHRSSWTHLAPKVHPGSAIWTSTRGDQQLDPQPEVHNLRYAKYDDGAIDDLAY
jgi:hypothetical protein